MRPRQVYANGGRKQQGVSAMNTIYLEANQVPSQLLGGYRGKKFAARIVESVTIPAEAGLWQGGSRETYRVVRLSDGADMPASDYSSAPWDTSRRERKIDLMPGIAVVRSSMFRGKDMGLTFMVHPADAVKMLPAPAELSGYDRLVLTCTKNFKASYSGRDRYQRGLDECRYNAGVLGGLDYPTRAQWDECKASLAARGYLNAAGAITVKGRNAV